MPLISVVIPSFNSARYLSETLNAILAQTFTDFEIILVDDGSTDNTEDVIAPFRGDNLRYVKRCSSGGPSQARNLGIQLAQGKYVALCDSDDVMLPTKLEQSVAFLEQCPDLGFIFGDMVLCHEDGTGLPGTFLSKFDFFQDLPKREIAPKRFVIDSRVGYEGLVFGNYVGTSGVVVPKSVLHAVGGFDEAMSLAEDLDIFLRIARMYDIGYLDVVGHRYRMRGSGLTGLGTTAMGPYIIRILRKQMEAGLSQPARQKARSRVARVFFDIGYCYQCRQELKMARGCYWSSLKEEWSWRALRGIVITLLGDRLFSHIRRFLMRDNKGLDDRSTVVDGSSDGTSDPGQSKKLRGHVPGTVRSRSIQVGSDTNRPEPFIEQFIGWEALCRALEHCDLVTRWESVLKSDSAATFFQTPLWCMTWYRCYQDEFEPIVLILKIADRDVAIAPLARIRSNGRVVFAGGSMSDYRDFICEDGRRRDAIPFFMSRVLIEASGGGFIIGHTTEKSDTKAVVCEWACSQKWVRVIVRTHPCRRFRFGPGARLDDLYKKKTIKQAYKYYRNATTLSLKRVRDVREWNDLREAFFAQHRLRQAMAGRAASFEDSRKQAFYSQLFESLSPEIHFSALWGFERAIAFMFSFAYRQVLYYGAPSIDPLEAKHSPGLLHILEVMAECEKEGFREIDLTLGSASFKERFANYSVDLPTLYVYGKRSRFWIDSLGKWMTDTAKAALSSTTGSHDRWQALKERLGRTQRAMSRLMRTSPSRVVSSAMRRAGRLVFDSYTGVVFNLTKDDLKPVLPVLAPGDTCTYQRNRLEELLTWDGIDRERLTAMLQEAARRIAQGHVLHTYSVNRRLIHYGWSHRPTEPIQLPETGTSLVLPQGAIALYDFFTIETYRGRGMYPAMLTRLASDAFASGAPQVSIVCEASNRASRRAIERVGFRPGAVHRFRRILGFVGQAVYDKAESLSSSSHCCST